MYKTCTKDDKKMLERCFKVVLTLLSFGIKISINTKEREISLFNIRAPTRSERMRATRTVHEMAKDEARHGAGFKGLLNRYFG